MTTDHDTACRAALDADRSAMLAHENVLQLQSVANSYWESQFGYTAHGARAASESEIAALQNNPGLRNAFNAPRECADTKAEANALVDHRWEFAWMMVLAALVLAGFVWAAVRCL